MNSNSLRSQVEAEWTAEILRLSRVKDGAFREACQARGLTAGVLPVTGTVSYPVFGDLSLSIDRQPA